MAIYALPYADEERRLLDRWFADDEAFDSIYRTYKPALVAFCRARLTDRSEAEDACQEAFLRAYRSLPRFDRTQRLWPWLATIAANVCTDMRRKKQATPLSACDDDPRRHRTIDITEELEARARRNLVGAALRDLPESYRRPVYLADAEGWSYADIATTEKRSVASVRTNLMRGRTAFKERAKAIAEERGMWPLSAMLPFPSMRARFLAWRAARNADGLSSASPVAFTIAQAAAATIAVLSTVAPAAAADGADVVQPVPITHVVSTSSAAAPAPPPGTSTPTRQPAVTPPAPPAVAAPQTSTDVDLDGDRRLVLGSVRWDSDGDGDDDRTIWLGVDSDCASDTWREECEAVSPTIGGAIPAQDDDRP